MTQWLTNSDVAWTLEWLGLDQDPSVFEGYGDAGADTFVLDLLEGFTVKHSWITDVLKSRAGREQRISRNDTDRQSYAGAAYLAGANPRATRAKLARHAAIGSVFLLGLPHEELTLRTNASGTTVYVHAGALALKDWVKPGQRVVVARRNVTSMQMDFVNAVVQSKTIDSILLDIAPGVVGMYGGSIMPAVPVFLEPQQSFARYSTEVETWQLDARYAKPIDFAPTLAKLALGPITASSALDSVTLTARNFGLVGNLTTVSFVEDAAAPVAGSYAELAGFGSPYGAVTIHFRGGVTTLAQLAALIDANSSLIKMTGTWTGSATLASGTGDEFTNQPLTGASDQGDVGTGAALATYNGDGIVRPVWDRLIDNESTNTDGVHAMTQILDHGGVPYSLGTADKADWFRAVVLTGGDQAAWQWFKLFMSTVKGRQKKFWLPTWRKDLTFVSKATNTVTVSTLDGSDFAAWWPQQREHIQIVEANGTVTRAKITAAVDNGNGTRTLTIGQTLSTSSVVMISWLELCRFESADEFETTHSASGFDVSMIARVVP
jgi:hypothetical protein